MKKRNIAAAVTALLLGMLFTTGVYAQGSINVSADKDSCEQGESVTVTVEATVDDDSAVPPQISIEYNPARLQFDACSCEYGGGGGGLVTISDTFATLDFTTLSGGEAKVSVSGVLSEDSSETAAGEISISVNGEDTAVGSDEMSFTDTGVEASTIETGDGRVVETVFADEFMPSLFHKETCDYQGQTVECAKFDMGDVTILYTNDTMGTDAKFMMYNTSTSEMSDFRMIEGIENRFIIVLNECEGEAPLGYTKAVLDWNGQTLTAYMNMDAANGVLSTFNNVSASEFFLVYAMSSEGNKGWYQYDQNEGTYQRYFAILGEGGTSDTAGNEDVKSEGGDGVLGGIISAKTQSILLIVFAVLTLGLIVAVIILAVKLSGNGEYYYGDEYYGDEEQDAAEEDEEDEQIRSNASVKRKQVGMTAAAYVTQQLEEDDDDDEEDDEDDAPRLSKKELRELKREEKWRLKEEKRAAKLREKGYEEATPLDWSSFNAGEQEEDGEERARYGNSRPPKYMNGEDEDADYREDDYRNDQDDSAEENMEDEEEDIPIYSTQRERKRREYESGHAAADAHPGVSYGEDATSEALPPRRVVSTERDNDERKRAAREDEQIERQKRLFEQQQQLERQRIMEQERIREEQKTQQASFESNVNDDLDDDFQFEFLNL